MRPLMVAAAFDPSVEIGATTKGDYKAIITVGLDWREMTIYVLDAFIRRASLDQTIAAAYNRHAEFGFLAFGVETNLFQKLLLREFDRAAQERKRYLPVREIENRLPKEARVSGLSPLVERGKIRFQRGQGDQDLLVEQLLFFPSRTVHDDGPDALEMAVRLLSQLPMPGSHCYERVEERRFKWQPGMY